MVRERILNTFIVPPFLVDVMLTQLHFRLDIAHFTPAYRKRAH